MYPAHSVGVSALFLRVSEQERDMAGIEWMQKGPFGIMVHWLKSTPGLSDGEVPDWDRQVDEFPVTEVCRKIAATGARWLLFTIGQNNGYYCAPNQRLESLLPGRCSKRDLFGEVAGELSKYDVKTIAYLPAGMVSAPADLQELFGWNADPVDKAIFMNRYVEFVRDYALRYGDRLAGWWFDGCYDRRRTRGTYGNSWFKTVDWFGAARAGNPEAVIAMNPGCNTYQSVFEEEDYIGGESNTLAIRPGTPLCGGTQQWHSLVPINGDKETNVWGHGKPGPLSGNRFTFDELLNFVYDCHLNGGAVTLNIVISREGSMPEETLKQLAEIAEKIASIKDGIAPPPDLWSPLG